MFRFDSIFGFNGRIRGLRKKWCRYRLKALRLEGSSKSRILNQLDSVEQELRTLEGQDLRRLDRNRIAASVEHGLKNVYEELSSKKRKTEAAEEKRVAELEKELREYK
ncbi:MAG: hypothetical protein KAT28_04800 [Candidatus Aenigmarchaeota archaeon]|nr:hypothetical protein [Candidatus Aenigmarchaeota archaeon]